MYVYLYIYIHIYFLCISIHMYIHMFMCIYLCIYIYIHTHICIHTFTNMFLRFSWMYRVLSYVLYLPFVKDSRPVGVNDVHYSANEPYSNAPDRPQTVHTCVYIMSRTQWDLTISRTQYIQATNCPHTVHIYKYIPPKDGEIALQTPHTDFSRDC